MGYNGYPDVDRNMITTAVKAARRILKTYEQERQEVRGRLAKANAELRQMRVRRARFERRRKNAGDVNRLINTCRANFVEYQKICQHGFPFWDIMGGAEHAALELAVSNAKEAEGKVAAIRKELDKKEKAARVMQQLIKTMNGIKL